MRKRLLIRLACLTWILLTSATSAVSLAVEPPVDATAVADASAVRSDLSLYSGRPTNPVPVIAGRDGSQQLIVMRTDGGGMPSDLTRDVSYTVEPDQIVAVDRSGHATPLGEGQATVTARAPDGRSASLKLQVAHFAEDLPLNFPNEVVPLFTKYGCNSGGCHGKASGQNGFRLSLLGFEPAEDYEFLLKEGRGRRLFPAAPDRSLVLLKATGRLPHGGGARIEPDSAPYRVLHRWISQGMPYGNESDPVVVGIEVFPRAMTLKPGSAQQIVVISHYSDGSLRDVTRLSQLSANDPEMAEVSATGLVRTQQQTGRTAIMCIFQGHVDVFRATLPLGVDVANLPPPANYIDTWVFRQLQELGLPPSNLCDDSTFVRRATVTIAGRVPTRAEVVAFLDESSPDKRQRLVNDLIDSNDYADQFATKWAAILRNKRTGDQDKRATFAFYYWIRDRLLENYPYDAFVRDIVAASGDVSIHPPVAWYREVRDSSALVEDTAQLFLGMRIQCARCHHHPFEKWSQRDYHSFSAFYSQVGRKQSEFGNQDRIIHRRGTASVQDPKTGEQLLPTGLDGPPTEVSPWDDPRQRLVDWMTQPANPFFSRALVNRYWKHFFGRGLVDPEDDIRVTNPASNPELLDALAKDFVDHRYDLKHLVRTICTSQVFQLAADPNAYNQQDKQNFSRFYPRRLDAEVLLDAIDQLTGQPTQYAGMPAGTRAIQLPDNGFDSYFLKVFGRPEASSACECERSADASLSQSLHLLNSQDILGKVSADTGRAAQLAADPRPLEQRIQELYFLAFARSPDAEELAVATDYIQSKATPREGFEDVIWALINTKEFLFNH